MLKLYKTIDDTNVINKDKTFIIEYPIKFKEVTSIISPIITLHVDDGFNIVGCNYCFLTEFNRFYFIQDIQILQKNVIRLTLECDVLESFKDEILSSMCEYEKTVSSGDYLPISENVDVRKEIDIYESDVKLDLQKIMVLSTMGGA